MSRCFKNAALVPLALMLICAVSPAAACEFNLTGKLYVSQANGPQLTLLLTQRGTTVSGRAQWFVSASGALQNEGGVSGQASGRDVELRIVWQNPSIHRIAWYRGTYRDDGVIDGITHPDHDPTLRTRWELLPRRCQPDPPTLAIRNDVSGKLKLDFAVATHGRTYGTFRVFRDDAEILARPVSMPGNAGNKGFAFIAADVPEAAKFHVCFEIDGGNTVCGGKVQRPMSEREVSAASVALPGSGVMGPDKVRPEGGGANVDAAPPLATSSYTAGGPGPSSAGRCQPGLVWRQASISDRVCVTPELRMRIRAENTTAAGNYDPAGAYGPNSCRSGLVWREAFDGDTVCVNPSIRAQVAEENRTAAEHRQ